MDIKLCDCGCGNPAPIAKMTSKKQGCIKGQPQRFICGHNRNWLGKKHSEETKNKISTGKLRDNNPNWKGGIQLQSGYIYELCPDHPYAGVDGRVAQHRLVMERYLGRYLEPDEVAHHLDEIRHHNLIENLELCLKSVHTKYHMEGKPLSKEHCLQISERMKGNQFWQFRKKNKS